MTGGNVKFKRAALSKYPLTQEKIGDQQYGFVDNSVLPGQYLKLQRYNDNVKGEKTKNKTKITFCFFATTVSTAEKGLRTSPISRKIVIKQ